MAQNGKTGADGGAIQEDVDILKKDLSMLRDDLGTLIHQLVDEGQAKGMEKKSALKSELELKANELKHRTGQAKDKVKASGKKAVAASEDTIRERPLMSVLVVFLLGIILGKVFDLRSSS